MKLDKLFCDLFTGPDGATVHLGRVGAVPMLLSGLALPYVMIFKGIPVDVMSALTGYGALGAGVWALVAGAKNIDTPTGGSQ